MSERITFKTICRQIDQANSYILNERNKAFQFVKELRKLNNNIVIPMNNIRNIWKLLKQILRYQIIFIN